MIQGLFRHIISFFSFFFEWPFTVINICVRMTHALYFDRSSNFVRTVAIGCANIFDAIWALTQYDNRFLGTGNSIIGLRSWDRLISSMEIPILVRSHLYIETAYLNWRLRSKDWFGVRLSVNLWRHHIPRCTSLCESHYLLRFYQLDLQLKGLHVSNGW